jgi:acyl carrier protein
MNVTTVLARTRAYVEESFLYMRPGFVLRDQDRLFEKGVIDSMGVVELIGFLEAEFGVAVRDEDISEGNLGTLADIARYVTSRNGHGDASVSHLGNTR